MNSPDTSPTDLVRPRTPSLLFDEAWYLARYPDAAASDLEPLSYYLDVGDAAGHFPHPLFDADFYSEQHPDLAREGGARLRHYVDVGEKSGSWPSRFFDPRFYREQNPDLEDYPGTLLDHFHRFGAAELRAPNPLFDPSVYCDQRAHHDEALSHPLLDYLGYGDGMGLAPHVLFDPTHYGAQHPGLPEKGGARLAHYLAAGEESRSDPHPLFRAHFYVERCDCFAGSGAPPLVHYLKHGEAQGCFPNPLFDPVFYLDANPDLKGIDSLLAHYAAFGSHEGRSPNACFSPDFYFAQVRDPTVTNRDVLLHYLDGGEREGRLPHPLFDPGYYSEQGPDLEGSGGSLLGHYLLFGHRVEMSPHPLFQPAYYVSQLRPVPAPGKNLLVHYLEAGASQSLKPNPLFDPTHYRTHADTTGSVPLEHYATWGGKTGICPSALFDAAWVTAQMPSRARKRMGPLDYYLRMGGALEKGPHPLFSPSWYVAEYPEVKASALDPLSHFVEIGAAKGFDPHPLFNSSWYRDFYADRFDDDSPAIFHYLQQGHASGCAPNPLFDPVFYEQHPEVRLRQGETALAHFCRVGMEAAPRPSPIYSFCFQFFRNRSKARRARSANPASGYMTEDYAGVTSPESEIAIDLPATYRPDVSIIIPVFGQIVYTLACLRSISRAQNHAQYEVILLDDHSPVDQFKVFSQIENLRVFRNSEQLGFLHTCNRGAREARGKDLIFLNNDTLVTDQWIDRLIETREAFPNAGLIGSKLLFPDGRLQEAGSVVFRDGSALNYGYGEDPANPLYAFARKADYVSAASVLISAKTFEQLDGFDERYAPAFYEDTDLAFRIREAGMDVVYQPASTVIHFGGATHGRSIDAPLKRYQVLNEKTFLRRWKTKLKRHPMPRSKPRQAASRLNGPRALVIDATILTPDQDSGSLRMLNLMRVLQSLGFAVTFMPSDLVQNEDYVERLQRMGFQVATAPHVVSSDRFLEEVGTEFELCIVSRPDTAERCLDSVRLLCPNALILYDTVDLHFLRRERELRLTGVASATESIRTQELWAVGRADSAVTVSAFDRKMLLERVPDASVHVISNIHEVHPAKTPFAERSGIMFIGGFQHTPNVDAVRWFIADVLPTIHNRIPDLRFHIIGLNPPDEICDEACEHVIIEGFIENVDEQFSNRRLSIAPLRYGSGVKGKINQSMAYGLPCVATPPAVEGMDLDWESEILVADSAQHFAEAIIELYENEALWTTLAHNSVASIERSYSMAVAEEGVREIFRHHGRSLPGQAGQTISSSRG